MTERYSESEKAALGAKGQAFKNPDGHFSYPIADEADMSDAVKAVGRSGASHNAVRAFIVRVAGKLGLSSQVPETWSPDGSVKLEKFDQVVPLWKDDSQQLVYGVVMSPGITDSQGDESDAAEIQKAAHRFLVAYRKHDVQHSEHAAGVETVESFIAPADMQIEGEKVLKGAWVLVTHVSDPAVWQQVLKGELTGYSIGGSGVREYA